MAGQVTEQEEKLKMLFSDLEAGFKKLDKTKDADKQLTLLKEITNNLKESKTLIKDFEREARVDGMPAKELAEKKSALVNELNNYIAMKKAYSSALEQRQELFDDKGKAPAASTVERGLEGMTTQELMGKGRKEISAIDATLVRAERVMEDTLQIGTTTAATLEDQTKQMSKVVDDLAEMEFTMKKASQVIRDIGKGLLTDQCIRTLLFVVVLGVVAIIILKVVRPGKKGPGVVPKPNYDAFPEAKVPNPVGRRMLLGLLHELLAAAARDGTGGTGELM